MDMSINFPHLGIYLDHVGKSINIGGFEITYYGMIIAVGMLLGIWFIILEAKRTNQNQDFYLDLLIIAIVSGVIGARLYYVVFNWETYSGNLREIFDIRSGGLAIYGGMLFGMLGAAIFCKIKKTSFFKMADTACIGIVIGQILGRWGNFFNREAFGEYTNNFLAMQLPVSAVRKSEITPQMLQHLITYNGVEYIQVHPTFLYECLWNILLLAVLMWYRRHKKSQGELFLMYLVGYGLGRAWIEGLRTDQLLLPGMGIPVSQVLSVCLVVGGSAMIITKRTLQIKRDALKKQRVTDENESKHTGDEENEGNSKGIEEQDRGITGKTQ